VLGEVVQPEEASRRPQSRYDGTTEIAFVEQPGAVAADRRQALGEAPIHHRGAGRDRLAAWDVQRSQYRVVGDLGRRPGGGRGEGRPDLESVTGQRDRRLGHVGQRLRPELGEGVLEQPDRAGHGGRRRAPRGDRVEARRGQRLVVERAWQRARSVAGDRVGARRNVHHERVAPEPAGLRFDDVENECRRYRRVDRAGAGREQFGAGGGGARIGRGDAGRHAAEATRPCRS
jgi:hypothetical protein